MNLQLFAHKKGMVALVTEETANPETRCQEI